MPSTSAVTVFACGDVMTGRGIDQILPHPGEAGLRERYLRDARDYVRLAERVSGPIGVPVDFGWPWGDALPVIGSMAPAVRVINLETSITRSGTFSAGKPVHYRMSPANLPCVTAVQPDACALANNHVLDFGRPGLADTLAWLAGAGLRAAGPGVTSPRPGGPPRYRCRAVVAPWSSPAAARPAGSRPTGPREPGDRARLRLHWK